MPEHTPNPPSSLFDHLDLFCGDVTPGRAVVFARFPKSRQHDAWELSGRIRGPFTTRGSTLPSNADFKSQPHPDFVVARALVMDPCTWTPETPNVYNVTLELRSAGKVVETFDTMWGLRNFYPQRRSFYFDGKRVVLRGVCTSAQFNCSVAIDAWRDAAVTRVLETIDEPWLEQATRAGVPTIVKLPSDEPLDIERLRRIARYAATVLIVVPAEMKLPITIRSAVPNALFAQSLSPKEQLHSWAHVAWVQSTDVAQVAAALSIPMVAVANVSSESLIEAKVACDQLQAELAPLGQFAGYIVQVK